MDSRQGDRGPVRLGVVSFLNALPLYESLVGGRGVEIIAAVPSRLGGMLTAGQCDAALLPVVEHWRAGDGLERISNACIASDGETMTVRVFSRVPPDRVRRLHVDGDSRTSVVLAQVIWLELYGRPLELIHWGEPCFVDGDDAAPGTAVTAPCARCLPAEAEALLAIGDKVVRDRPRGFGFEVDLGAAWKHLTGLPFVFAAWYGWRNRSHRALAGMLETARDAGVAAVARLAAEYGPTQGWPVDLARRYLGEHMRYTLDEAMQQGMDRFLELAAGRGLLRREYCPSSKMAVEARLGGVRDRGGEA